MRGCLTFVVVLCGVVYFFATDSPERLPDVESRGQTMDLVAKGRSVALDANADVLSRKYTWSDVNRRKYRVRGGRVSYRAGTGDKPLSMTVRLRRHRVEAAINAFGIPRRMAGNYTITYRSQRELQRKQRARTRDLQSRGFEKANTGALAPNYGWILDRSRADLAPTMRGLQTLAVNRGYKTMRDLYGMVASFVQSLEYVIPPMERVLPNGQRVVTGGVNMPQEALVEGKGDCDTVSMLFAGLTANLQRTQTILVVGERGFDHAFIGIRGIPRRGDRYLTVQGTHFILVELTNLFPIGVVPPTSWKFLQRNMYRVIPLG